jgi:L-threonylcarbamoyladenylate synthase
LRAADQLGLETVVVAQPTGDGIAVAIRDRLKRAAFGSAKG